MNRRLFLASLMLAFFTAGCGPKPDHKAEIVNEVLSAPNDRALLVGINAYPGAELSGCVNDVHDMAKFLIEKYGYAPEDIRILTDGAATKDAIMDGVHWLSSNTRAGCRRLFHFSGHGVLWAGIDVEKQPFGINQVICPVDFEWKPEKMVQDVELIREFSKMHHGTIFNWISDSCHSGDLSRSVRKDKARSYPLVPPVVRTQLARAKIKKPREALLNVGFISGCKWDQTSADTFDVAAQKSRGALTMKFLYHMEPEEVRNTQSNALIVENLTKSLAKDGYDQEPTADGAQRNRLFQK